MKLKYTRPIGRYTNKENGKSYNIKTGQDTGGYKWYYYLYMGTRYIISERNFYIIFTKTEVEKL